MAPIEIFAIYVVWVDVASLEVLVQVDVLDASLTLWWQHSELLLCFSDGTIGMYRFAADANERPVRKQPRLASAGSTASTASAASTMEDATGLVGPGIWQAICKASKRQGVR